MWINRHRPTLRQTSIGNRDVRVVTTGGAMFRHILIPTDGSALSARAVESGLALAKSLAARATLLTVIEPFHVLALAPDQVADTEASYKRHAHAAAAQVLAAGDKLAQRAGVAYATVQLEHEEPYRAIIETAKKNGCDLIAMSSHGRRGVAAAVLGSVTTKVLTHCSLPVLVYR
jgi:nucleotide-binding universal stress UspA family protein